GARLAARDGVSALAHGILLEQHGIDETALFSAMGSALGQRGDFADLFLKETTAESWSLEGGAVRGSSYRRDAGFGLRVLKGEEATLASSQRIDAAALRHVAARLRGTADGAPRHGATAAPRAQ
ncbi:PmbA/TldA family metallopeptidase, partial [Burkholderia glumae]